MDEVEGKGHQIVSSHIAARVAGDGIDEGSLAVAAEAADAGCPFTTLLRAAGAQVEYTTAIGGGS
jgi:hypothetical protein